MNEIPTPTATPTAQPLDDENSQAFRTGHIAILGRPNVGKSTLLNYILGEKIAITSRKPQTTRQNLLGIHSDACTQMIFLDTPGLHLQADKKINQYMNRAAKQATAFVDLIIHLSEANRWTADDDYVVDFLQTVDVPVIHVTNKMDLLKDTKLLIPLTEQIAARFAYQEIVPVSALKNTNVKYLLDVIRKYLPLGEPIYPTDQLTTANMRFLASEIVREKLFKVLHQELPYSLAVITEQYKETDEAVEIYVTILLDRSSQKPIVIGKAGKTLKYIGTQARKDLEVILDKKVRLKTWVKVKENWTDNDKALQQLGLNDRLP